MRLGFSEAAEHVARRRCAPSSEPPPEPLAVPAHSRRNRPGFAGRSDWSIRDLLADTGGWCSSRAVDLGRQLPECASHGRPHPGGGEVQPGIPPSQLIERDYAGRLHDHYGRSPSWVRAACRRPPARPALLAGKITRNRFTHRRVAGSSASLAKRMGRGRSRHPARRLPPMSVAASLRSARCATNSETTIV